MTESMLQTIQHNWIIKLVNKIIVILTAVSLVLILFQWSKLPPLIPLWYALPWGADQLASPLWLFILPLGSAIIFGINTAISIYLVLDHLVFVQLLYLTSLLVSFLSFITLTKILTLIT